MHWPQRRRRAERGRRDRGRGRHRESDRERQQREQRESESDCEAQSRASKCGEMSGRVTCTLVAPLCVFVCVPVVTAGVRVSVVLRLGLAVSVALLTCTPHTPRAEQQEEVSGATEGRRDGESGKLGTEK